MSIQSGLKENLIIQLQKNEEQTNIISDLKTQLEEYEKRINPLSDDNAKKKKQIKELKQLNQIKTDEAKKYKNIIEGLRVEINQHKDKENLKALVTYIDEKLNERSIDTIRIDQYQQKGVVNDESNHKVQIMGIAIVCLCLIILGLIFYIITEMNNLIEIEYIE